MGFWENVFRKAFWDTLSFFEQTPKVLLLWVAGFVLTGFWVLAIQGRQKFREHLIANGIIAALGGITAWILFFPYFFFKAPADVYSDTSLQLRLSQEHERSAIQARNAADSQLRTERDQWKRSALSCKPGSELQQKLKDAQSLIAGLQAQLALGHAGEPLSVTSSAYDMKGNDKVKRVRQIILMTNKPINPGRGKDPSTQECF